MFKWLYQLVSIHHITQKWEENKIKASAPWTTTARSGEWTHWSEHILETHIIFFNYRLPNYKTKVQVAYSSCSNFSIFSTILLHCLLNTIPTIAVPATRVIELWDTSQKIDCTIADVNSFLYKWQEARSGDSINLPFCVSQMVFIWYNFNQWSVKSQSKYLHSWD